MVAVERIVDATTAARVRVNHGAAAPPPSEVARIAEQLRELAEGIRSSETLVRVEVPPGDTEPGVLAPLHQELAAARAISQPSP